MRDHWITCKFDENFEVSNTGQVRNKKTGRILKPQLNRKGGYNRVYMNGKRYYVHRVVADTFYEGDHSNMDVNHIDGNHLNNHIANLEWCTRKQNINHAFETGLKYPVHKNVVRCRFCIDRYEHDICYGKEDGFFCAYGRR